MPIWKTGVLCRGNVHACVRPYVRPSTFTGLFSICFEISIWNLVYKFNRWHFMSGLSFITIDSHWLNLKPKVVQTYCFLNHDLINQVKFFKVDTYSISQEICTRFLLCCALLWLYIDWFSHIHQAYFIGTVAIVRLPQCQQSNPDEYG